MLFTEVRERYDLLNLTSKEVVNIFRDCKMSLDELRQFINIIDLQDVFFIEDDLVFTSKFVKVLSNQYLSNGILYLENNMQTKMFKEQFKDLHALDKFKYRYEYQQTQKYKNLHLNKFTKREMK